MTVAVPEGWTLRRLGDLLEEEDLRAADSPDDVTEVLSLTKRFGLIPQADRFDKRVALEDVGTYKVVRPGWIAYNPYVIWEGAIHGLKRHAPGVVSPAYLVWHRTEDDGGFLDHLLRTPELIRVYQSLSAGAVNRRRSINKIAFKQIEIACPPLSEQRRIASVLNRVQEAISLESKLVTATEELRAMALERLMAAGIDGETQVETSLGQLSKSWSVETLADLVDSIDYGTSVKCGYEATGFPVLRIPNVIGGVVDVEDLKFGRPKAAEVPAKRLELGDLLFVRTNGAQVNAGRCAMFADELEDCYFASYLIRVRVRPDRLLPAFLNEYARSAFGRRFLSGQAIRTADGKFNINTGTIERVQVAVPPTLDEQATIVGRLADIDQKKGMHERMVRTLTATFVSLRHRLTTGEVRIEADAAVEDDLAQARA